MYRILTNLINKRYYATKEVAQEKCDVAFGMNKITEEQYTELTILINTIYVDITE